MIDITREKLFTLGVIARVLPSTRRGRPTHPSTLLRWATKGVRGRRLDAVRIGGNWYTSLEALGRFAEAPAPAAEACESPPGRPRPTGRRGVRAARALAGRRL